MQNRCKFFAKTRGHRCKKEVKIEKRRLLNAFCVFFLLYNRKFIDFEKDKLLALDFSRDAYAWEYFVVRIIFGDKKRKWNLPELEAYLEPRFYAISRKYYESEMRWFIQESRNF